jgi:glycerol-1-phosphate dehydrogenase [NAD(P)+]
VDTVFDKAKSMVFPRHVLVGKDVLEAVPDLALDLDLHPEGVVVTGPNTRDVAGERVQAMLEDAGYEAHLVEATGHDRKAAEATVEEVDGTGSRFVFGVGGGRVIDQAKLCADRIGGPLVSVPTSAAHDGITSPRASLQTEGEATSIDAVAPHGIVADTSVIIQAPYRLLAAGCADAISNISAVRDWKLAHRLRGEPLSSFSAVLAETAADLVIDHAEQIRPGIEESAWIAVKALIVSGVSMSVAGSSRPASGAEHMFSHALDRIAPREALHGEQVGLGTILMLNLHNGPEHEVRQALDAIGAPTTAEAAGLSREDVLEALTSAHEIRDRYTILGSDGLTRSAAEQLVSATGVCP